MAFSSPMAWLFASMARPFGSRKFLAYPSAALISSPFLPLPFTSCVRITFISIIFLSSVMCFLKNQLTDGGGSCTGPASAVESAFCSSLSVRSL